MTAIQQQPPLMYMHPQPKCLHTPTNTNSRGAALSDGGQGEGATQAGVALLPCGGGGGLVERAAARKGDAEARGRWGGRSRVVVVVVPAAVHFAPLPPAFVAGKGTCRSRRWYECAPKERRGDETTFTTTGRPRMDG
jgi:hypothetical protein